MAKNPYAERHLASVVRAMSATLQTIEVESQLARDEIAGLFPDHPKDAADWSFTYARRATSAATELIDLARMLVEHVDQA